MRLTRSALWSVNAVLSHRFHNPRGVRAFSAFPLSDEWDKLNVSEGFGSGEKGDSGDVNDPSREAAFYRKLEMAERAHDRSGMGGGFGVSDGFNSGMDGREYQLKKAAAYFEFDPLEVSQNDYTFRPDVNFSSGLAYDPTDLDLRKPGVHKPNRRKEVRVSTDDVLREADFRNVKFLAQFITEAGIINKRSNFEQTGISAKAQRKIAREIKTARAFGLMPFTCMGTKEFKYGGTMEELDRDFEFESTSYDHNFVEEGPEDA